MSETCTKPDRDLFTCPIWNLGRVAKRSLRHTFYMKTILTSVTTWLLTSYTTVTHCLVASISIGLKTCSALATLTGMFLLKDLFDRPQESRVWVIWLSWMSHLALVPSCRGIRTASSVRGWMIILRLRSRLRVPTNFCTSALPRYRVMTNIADASSGPS